jgi:DNA-binding transcriptional regulator YiaG
MTRRDLALLARTRDHCRTGRARAIREASGLTQAEIASPCNVTAGAIYHWETGGRVPRGEAALRYGRLLRDLEKRANRAAGQVPA